MKIVIAGYGVEGKSNLAYFRRKFPGAEFVVADAREVVGAPEGVAVQSGADAFSRLDDADMVVRTAGLPPRNISTSGKIWSATNEFFAECPAPIIGVTGTKGKGTTCSLIASILRAAGKTVHLVGNIGVPALDVLSEITADDIVVYELSSFQLWDLEASPHIAVVLMIEPDHLDVHADMEEYVVAKANIRQYQTAKDACLYHPSNEYARQVAFSSEAAAPQRYGVADDGACYVKENTFFVQNDPICSVDTLQVVGQHNRENACAAISAAWQYTQDKAAIEKGLRSFTGLPHRLKFVREVGGVKYFDDSIATTPGSAIAALESFAGPKIIILGGHDKGAGYNDVLKRCQATDTTVIAIGESGKKIHESAEQFGVTSYRVEGLMNDVVAKASTIARPGDTVILSPASASFDQYKNYADRGEQFVAAVEALT